MSTIDDAIAEMKAKAQPAVRLVPTDEQSGITIGGTPRLPKDFTWPSFKGKPLAFIAQIDAAVVTRALCNDRPAWFPEHGALAFFYDSEQSTWGFDPRDRGSWHVEWFAAKTAISEVNLPQEIPEHARYYARSFESQLVSSYPGPTRLSIDTSGLTSEDDERLQDFVRLGEQASLMHQLLGFPRPIQNDNLELMCQMAANGFYCGETTNHKTPEALALRAGVADWRLLFQLDSDDDAGMMWGDCGMLYFWVREQDAKAGDFSRVWMVLQCG